MLGFGIWITLYISVSTTMRRNSKKKETCTHFIFALLPKTNRHHLYRREQGTGKRKKNKRIYNRKKNRVPLGGEQERENGHFFGGWFSLCECVCVSFGDVLAALREKLCLFGEHMFFRLTSTSRTVRSDMRGWIVTDEGDKGSVKLDVLIYRLVLIFVLPPDFMEGYG